MAELPVFRGRTREEHISRWSELEQREGMIKLEKGAVIDSLEKKLGESSVEGFAWEMGEGSVKKLYQYADVYRRLLRMEDSTRVEILDWLENGQLHYTHLREAHARFESDEKLYEILAEAQDGNWTTRRLLEEIATRKNVVAFTGAPQSDEDHAPHGETGFERDDGAGDVPYGEDDPFAGVPGSAAVVDLELRRLSAHVRDACELLAGREPDEATLRMLEEMKKALLEAERKLMEKKAPAGPLEGGMDTAGVQATG